MMQIGKKVLVLGGVALVAAAGLCDRGRRPEPADAQGLELRDQGRQARAQGQSRDQCRTAAGARKCARAIA